MIKKAKNKGRLGQQKKQEWNNSKTEALCQAFLLLRSQSEVKDFLRDLLTEPELIEFGNRFYAAQMLTKGVHYNAIAEDTGLSSRTIARVQHWRKSGTGGYKRVLARLAK